MRLVPGGPEIPNALVAEQQRGNVLFVCGAGVSMAAGLPSFENLVKGVYRRLGEEWESHPAEHAVMTCGGKLFGQYDRVLRILERRLEASDARNSRDMRRRLREEVEQELAPRPSADLSHHLALLELSRGGDGAVRLLTTNFDTLFERSWVGGGGAALPSHAGPAMPRQGTGAFEGVLHLHGRLDDGDLGLNGTDLVLTSAEFGDAYLRSGWATRYVYDLARVYTLVLVGYRADDPPMRYLLEALEDDRARYPDLKPVYAFAPSAAAKESLERELWRAKGIEAILYGADHGNLHATLEEWRRYAADPTAWREHRLSEIFTTDPATVGADAIAEAVDLLAHGDAATLLTRLTPPADWWTVLAVARPLSAEAEAQAAWLRGRIDDPAMVRACVMSPPSDLLAFQAVLRRIPQLTTLLSPVLAKAWRLLARAAQERARDDAGAGWLVLHRIKSGDIDHSVREGVSKIVRPRLGVAIPFASPSTTKPDPTDPLKELLQVTFEPRNNPTVQEILLNWTAAEDELLFNHAERALAAALDEAADAGYLTGLDRASYGVKRVSSSGFGLLDAGFTPIVRLVTGLWARIADRDPERAAVISSRWSGSAHLLLIRLYLHALSDPKAYPSPAVPVAAVAGLDDRNFWVNDSTRETAHLFRARWSDFTEADRRALEERMRGGPPRHLLRQDGVVTDQVWQMVWDQLVFQHLEPLRNAGLVLTDASLQLLAEIGGRYPEGALSLPFDPTPLPGSAFVGPRGDPAVLTELPDDQIVATALRIRQSNWLLHGDVWRQFCEANPQQSLQAILAANGDDRWSPEVISPLLEVARETDDAELQAGISDLLTNLPPDRVIDVAAAAAWWVWERAKRSTSSDGNGILRAWDHLARVVYAPADSYTLQIAGMTIDAAFASPGGMLAIALGAMMSKRAWPTDAGLAEPFLSRLDTVAASHSRAGLQGRIILVRDLAFLEAVDPVWVSRHLTPRLRWTHAEATPLWRALTGRHIGRPSLFAPLIDDFLEAVKRAGPDENIGGLAGSLFQISQWAIDQPLSISASLLPKVRTALAAAAPKLRERTAWVLQARMHGEKGETFDRAECWRGEVGPVFRHIWPLDATARDPDTSRQLVFMALECGDAFPDAVEAIRLVVVPYEIVTISGWLQGQPSHQEATTGHPRAFVRLVNALLSSDPAALPPDLGTVLDECLAADPSVRSDPAFVRLNALRRRQAT
jgi:hypothetical protein